MVNGEGPEGPEYQHNIEGSQYKDIQLQLRGYWGEVRDWRDGTTIVQKTHDSSPQLIM